MSGDHHSALQDAFLNQARQQKISVTIFLVNGVKLQGVITWFDAYCILLKRDHLSQLVFKHAVSTVMPMAPIMMSQVEEEEEEGEEEGE